MEERLSPFFEQLDGVYRQGFPEAVEAFLRESLCWAEAETDRELELAVWNELGAFFRGAGRYEESLSAFRRAEVLAGELRGRDSGAYATVLNNMAAPAACCTGPGRRRAFSCVPWSATVRRAWRTATPIPAF